MVRWYKLNWVYPDIDSTWFSTPRTYKVIIWFRALVSNANVKLRPLHRGETSTGRARGGSIGSRESSSSPPGVRGAKRQGSVHKRKRRHRVCVISVDTLEIEVSTVYRASRVRVSRDGVSRDRVSCYRVSIAILWNVFHNHIDKPSVKLGARDPARSCTTRLRGTTSRASRGASNKASRCRLNTHIRLTPVC